MSQLCFEESSLRFGHICCFCILSILFPLLSRWNPPFLYDTELFSLDMKVCHVTSYYPKWPKLLIRLSITTESYDWSRTWEIRQAEPIRRLFSVIDITSTVNTYKPKAAMTILPEDLIKNLANLEGKNMECRRRKKFQLLNRIKPKYSWEFSIVWINFVSLS